jgi:hypothetical protein
MTILQKIIDPPLQSIAAGIPIGTGSQTHSTGTSHQGNSKFAWWLTLLERPAR